MTRSIKLIRYLAAFCILFILGSDGALGQGLARISGSVTDPTGGCRSWGDSCCHTLGYRREEHGDLKRRRWICLSVAGSG